eukprot:203089-Amphidinium_carterae.1
MAAQSSTRCLPHGTFDSGLYLGYAQNHWQSAQSLVRYLIFLNSHINTGTPEKAWLCILDAAPAHISVEFRCELQKAAKHIKLVFVSPGFTSLCQPLDVAVMRPFKSHLQRSCADDFAEEVLASRPTAHLQPISPNYLDGLLRLWFMLPPNQQYTVKPGPSLHVTAKTMSPSVP